MATPWSAWSATMARIITASTRRTCSPSSARAGAHDAMESRAGSRSNAGVQRRVALLAELSAARTDLLAALNDVPPELALTPGIVGSWSARDLVVHVAFWSDHAADALALATSGRGAEFVYDASQTDAMNDDVFRAGRGLAMDDAMAREEAAF